MLAETAPRPPADRSPSFLLVGPHDPSCGEYTFLSPPLGVWRLAGWLAAHGFDAEVFDPNDCAGSPAHALAEKLAARRYGVIGFSLTGMTLTHDLALAHLARRLLPDAVLVAGGMEATFNPELVLRLGPFDLGVLGEGEKPLIALGERLRVGGAASPSGIRGTFWRAPGGELVRLPQPALNRDELAAAIRATPYPLMPYGSYWRRLEEAYRVGALPVKADREARLAEIRSVRLITLNYCPMACTFCSSTNFLNVAGDATARLARLDADECVEMIRRIVAAHPGVRTVIFQDDIFAFTADTRVLALCERIVEAKAKGAIPARLGFISTNRVDSMDGERLAAMRRAGFRVIGLGIESFSPGVLAEFNKARIHPRIAPVLTAALGLGITPFLDLILTSPRGRLADLAENVRQAFHWIRAGCEVGVYPYVIPFSGAALAGDPALRPHTIHERRRVAGTAVSWEQPAKILPLDPAAREAILAIETEFEDRLAYLQQRVAHLPSRVRSLLWILCAVPLLAARGEAMPSRDEVLDEFLLRLPLLATLERLEIRALLASAAFPLERAHM